MKIRTFLPTSILFLAILACEQSAPAPTPINDRRVTIPANAVKHTPADDFWPPTAIAGWSQPEPMEGPVNTAGGEDSPFITPDAQKLYFFFTPDVSFPAERQLLDGVTGIWVTHRNGENWSEPERVRLSDPGELALDGCEFILDDWMVFCSARAGNQREIDLYTADFVNGEWTNWVIWGDEIIEYEVGEMHVTADGQELYFGSKRPGGHGGMDLWVSQKETDGWGEPVNLGPLVNTANDEGWPFVSVDGQELWYTGQSTKGRPGPAIFRSLRQPDGSWGAAEEIISSFAGEPTMSSDGRSLYFTHHYFSADLSQMIEADIYVTRQLEP